MTLAQRLIEPTNSVVKKLYLVPTLDKEFGSELFHPKFSPIPSALSELPDLHQFSQAFVVKIIEVWSGRRSVLQMNRNCHRSVLRRITELATPATKNCQIRKIYIAQPIEGVLEITVTLRVLDRVRSLSLRVEGVDKRWICTDLNLL